MPDPLWRQISADLVRRLHAGEFATTFPTEYDLVAQYGVSRHTIREALRQLRVTGLVVSRRGIGTRAVPERFEQPTGALYSLFRAIEAGGVPQTSRVLVLELRREPGVAAALELAADAELVHLRRVRDAGSEPLALDDAWLPAAIARPLLDADFSRTALYDELATRCGLHPDAGSERIGAIVPGAADRRLLGLPTGTAALFVERTTSAGGRAVEWRRTLVRADRYAFVSDWAPGERSSARAVPLGAGADPLEKSPLE